MSITIKYKAGAQLDRMFAIRVSSRFPRSLLNGVKFVCVVCATHSALPCFPLPILRASCPPISSNFVP